VKRAIKYLALKMRSYENFILVGYT